MHTYKIRDMVDTTSFNGAVGDGQRTLTSEGVLKVVLGAVQRKLDNQKLPRGNRVQVDQVGPLDVVLGGPAPVADGTANLMGALRTSMATCGYEDIPSFHRAEVMVAPALMTEGKQLQRSQSVGMGSNGRSAVANGVAVSDD